MAGKTVGLLVALGLGVVFTIVGYFVAFHFGKPILDNAKASTQWPKVDGVIASSEVAKSKDSDGDTMYSAEVVYKYEVEGRKLESDNVFFGGDYSSSSRSDASGTVNRYPTGKEVEVYYDPDDPSKAVLEPGAKWMSYMVYGIGMVFFVVGLLVVIGPLCYLALAAFVIGGAATGAIGKRRDPTFRDPAFRDRDPTRFDPGPSRDDRRVTNEFTPQSHDDDDGFDMG
jgi:hypothetical protein